MPSRILLAASILLLYILLSVLALPLSVMPRTQRPRLATSLSTRNWSSRIKDCIAAELVVAPLRLTLCLCPVLEVVLPLLISSQMLAVSLINESARVLRSWSGEAPGVRMPVLAAFLVLFTKGKLRVVPVDSKDETEGRCAVAAEELMGRRIAELINSSRDVRCSSELDRAGLA